MIYTTNAIQSMNYQLREVTKTRSQFTTDEAAYKLLYLAICDIELRTTTLGGNKEKKLLQRGRPPCRTSPTKLAVGSAVWGGASLGCDVYLMAMAPLVVVYIFAQRG